MSLTGASPRRLSVKWTTRGPQNTLGIPLATPQLPLDLGSASSLDFRIRSSIAGSTVAFSIVLVDATGRTSLPLFSSDYFHGQSIPHSSAKLFPTVRIPISRFRGVDISRVVEARWVFDRAAAGTIELAQLRLSRVSGLRLTHSEPFLTGDSCPGSEAPASLFANSVTADPVGRRSDARVSRIETSGDDRKIHILSDSRFPVLDALPELQVGEVVLRNGSFGARGDTRELIFTWNVESQGELAGARELVLRYGSAPRGGTWNLGTLDPR